MDKTVHHEAKILVGKRLQTKNYTNNWFQLWQVPLGKFFKMMKLGTFSGVKEGFSEEVTFELRPEKYTAINLCVGKMF